ncbi:unnamed protein product, partial [Prorocentrum cordatum]
AGWAWCGAAASSRRSCTACARATAATSGSGTPPCARRRPTGAYSTEAAPGRARWPWARPVARSSSAPRWPGSPSARWAP